MTKTTKKLTSDDLATIAAKEDFKAYKAFLAHEKCKDNTFNYYRYKHGFTAYHVGKMMDIPQTSVARYVTTENLTGSADALFRALNILDMMHADGSSNISSLDLF